MSRDITTILKNQKRKRLLNEQDPKLNIALSFVLQEEVSDYLNKAKEDLENTLKKVEEQIGLVEKVKIDLCDKISKIKDGYTPVKGKDYFDGKDADEIKIIRTVLSKIPKPKDGKDADEKSIVSQILSRIPRPKDGEPGKDGSPDTAEQIADKLNTLEEKVDIKVIKGLKTYFDNFNKKIQGIKSSQSSGGGMGNVVHKTFNVGSSTTSSSLDYKVAADGNAIWVYYNGQFLVKGTHYTVSNSTITWLETFGDNTYVDITYIRS